MKTGVLALGRQRLERLVILVDVRVFALQGGTKAAMAHAALIHSCVERMLAACNEHSTGYKRGIMWAFKLFDSSLTPLASRSMIKGLLDKEQHHLVRFNTAEENLTLFQQALEQVAAQVSSKRTNHCQQEDGKFEFVVRALQEILSEFTWDPLFLSDGSSSDEDLARSKRSVFQDEIGLRIKQNVVVLFSHIPSALKQFAGFVNTLPPQAPPADTDLLKALVSKIRNLQEPFELRNIRGCWIDVPSVSSSESIPGQGSPASIELKQRIQKNPIQSVLAEAKWGYMAMENFAIASDCLPLSMLWSSIAYPAPQVQSNERRVRVKLQINVQGRDAVPLQPEVCRLEAIPLNLNAATSSLMKENVSTLLKSGALPSKLKTYAPGNSPILNCSKVKIVVKSLVVKQKLAFKGSSFYLLHHHIEDQVTGRTRSNMGLDGKQSLEDCNPSADDVAYGDEILQQLQQEPMSITPGQRAWQVLLIAIARKQSVAEVDLYQDGICSPAILEPITLQYAVLLLRDQSVKNWSRDSYGNLNLQRQCFMTLGTVVEERDNDLQEHLARVTFTMTKQESRPRKRSASPVTEQDEPLVKREKVAGHEGRKPACSKSTYDNSRQVYNRIAHWQFILHRKSAGIGKHQIENKYLRPGQGKRPSKALLAIKCWIDQHMDKKQSAVEVLPSPAKAEGAEPSVEGAKGNFKSNPVGTLEATRPPDISTMPQIDMQQCLMEAYSEEQAETYLSSIEQMVQDCLKTEVGDLQVFAKSLVSNAQMAQCVLSKRDFIKESMHALTEALQHSGADCGLVHDSEQGTLPNPEYTCEGNDMSERNMFEKESTDSSDTGAERLATVEGQGAYSRLESCATPSKKACLGSGKDLCGVDAGEHIGSEVDDLDAVHSCVMKDDISISPSENDLEVVVAKQLVKRILVKPKKLAKQYKDCQHSNLTLSDSENFHNLEEKLIAYELQILFRMELIGRDTDGPLEQEKKTLVKEICQLLDDILFHLGGGVFGGESLLDYSIRVIRNRYKQHLPQTVGEIFDRMEFNGYIDPVSDSHPPPESTHLSTNLGGASHQNETQKGELAPIKESAVPTAKAPESAHQKKTLHTSGVSKGESKKKRHPVPQFKDELKIAMEKRKFASRLTHFGGPEPHHRLKKIKLHSQGHKLPTVSCATQANLRPRDQVVLETPMVVRQQALPVQQGNTEVESLCARVLMSTGRFGFGTPARVARQHQLTSRKRRLMLGSHKKPPGRGLPRIALEVMKAKRELQRSLTAGEPLHQQRNSKSLAQDDDTVVLNVTNVSPSSQAWTLLASDRLGQSAVGMMQNIATEVLFSSPEKSMEEVENKHSKHDMAENNGCSKTVVLSMGLAESPISASTAGAPSLRINGSDSRLVSASQDVETEIVHGFGSEAVTNIMMTKSNKKNRRKSLQASKSKKLNPSDSSGSPNSASASGNPSPITDEGPFRRSTAQSPTERQVLNNIENNGKSNSRPWSGNRRKSPRAPLSEEEIVPSSPVSLQACSTVKSKKEDLPKCSQSRSKSLVSALVSDFPSPVSKEDSSSGFRCAAASPAETQVFNAKNYESINQRSSTRNLRSSPPTSICDGRIASSSPICLATLSISPAFSPTATQPVERLISESPMNTSGRREDKQQPSHRTKVTSPPDVCSGRSLEAVISSRTRGMYMESPLRIRRNSKVCCLDPPTSTVANKPIGEDVNIEFGEGANNLALDIEDIMVTRSGKRIEQQFTKGRSPKESFTASPSLERTINILKGVTCADSIVAPQNTYDESPVNLRSNKKSLFFPPIPCSASPYQSPSCEGAHHLVDLGLDQVISNILDSNEMLNSSSAAKYHPQPVEENAEAFDEGPSLQDMCTVQQPRLRPEARLSSSFPRAHKRKEIGLADEDPVGVGRETRVGKENCKPGRKKIRRALEGSPSHSQSREVTSKSISRRSRSATTSPQ